MIITQMMFSQIQIWNNNCPSPGVNKQ